MTTAAKPRQCDIGVLGLDPNGRAFAQALLAQGLPVATLADGADLADENQTREFKPSRMAANAGELVEGLQSPRLLILCGPDTAGNGFGETLGRLEPGDLLIDASQDYFRHCARRAQAMAENGVGYLGLTKLRANKSGGRAALLAGGRPEIFQGALWLLEALASSAEGEASIHYTGTASSEHFAQAAQEAVELSIARLIRETSALLSLILAVDETKSAQIHDLWQLGAVEEHMCEENARRAGHAARETGVPCPILSAATGSRVFSACEETSRFECTLFRHPIGSLSEDKAELINELHEALQIGALLAYVEGTALLAAGSARNGFGLPVAEIVGHWQASCGRRTGLLQELETAVRLTPSQSNLLCDDDVSERVMRGQEELRRAVACANRLQLPTPVLTAALDYLDFSRDAWLPVNLIQTPASRYEPAF